MLVIFDCDGVLVDSENISCEVLAESLTCAGLPTTLVQARTEYQGLLLSDIVALAQRKLGHRLPQGWLGGYERKRAEVFREELRAVAGARQAVEEVLDAGFAVCIASQGKLEKTRLSLELTGLRDLFAEEALFSAHTVARGKPHPDLFLHAAGEMSAAPSECVVVEDSPSGVQGAVAAGMRALGYAADADVAELAQAGAKVFWAMVEVPRLVRPVS